MASLQNEQIDQSYQGLIKTANNQGSAPFPPAKLQYGNGSELPILIGDGTSVGIGDIVTIQSGTRNIDLNSQNLALNGLSSVDGAAGTVQYINGTFTYGASFPGAPATSVDFTNATVTGLPSGGGAAAYSAAVPSGMDGVIPYGSVGGGNYRTTRVITSASLADAYNPGTDSAYYELIAMQEGTTLSELIIEVSIAGGAGSTAEIALYDTGISSGEVDGGSKLQSLGTVDISTTGQKVVTLGTPFTMPAGKTNGQIMIVVWPSDHNVRFEGWSNSVGGPGLKRFGTTWYFTKSTFIKPGVTPGTTLPASLSGVERWAAVQRPIAIWYK